MAKQTPNKPTEEELKAKEEEAVKAAEELEGRQQIPQDEEEDDQGTPEDNDGEDIETEETEETEEEAEEELEEAEPSKERFKKEVIEKEKKLSASARENQKIYAKNRVINQALAEAEAVPEPTEDELIREYPDWDVMSDVEKKLAKETLITRGWRNVIKQAQDQATKIEKWNDSVDEYLDSPQTLIENPDLEGKTAEFREFAINEANNSVPFNILVSAFLHQHAQSQKPSKGRMFEKSLGGSNEKPIPKKNTLTLEEARKLRETNYSLYKEKLKAGLIELDF